MNQKDWKQINGILREKQIDSSQIKFINCVKIHPTETQEHFMAKALESFKLVKEGYPVLTEVWTADHRRRFDLLDLSDGRVIEFETDKKIKKLDADKTIYVDKVKA